MKEMKKCISPLTRLTMIKSSKLKCKELNESLKPLFVNSAIRFVCDVSLAPLRTAFVAATC